MRILILGALIEHHAGSRRWWGLAPTGPLATTASELLARGHDVVMPVEPDRHLTSEIEAIIMREAADAVIVDPAVYSCLGHATSAGPVVVDHGDVTAILAALGIDDAAQTMPDRNAAVPMAALRHVGISATCGAASVLAAITRADAAQLDGETVIVTGFGECSPNERETIADAVGQLERRFIRLALLVEPQDAQAFSGFDEIRLRVSTLDHAEALDEKLLELAAVDLTVTIAAELDDDLDLAETVADVAETRGVDVSYVWRHESSPMVRQAGDAALFDRGEQSQVAAFEAGPVPSLVRLVTGEPIAAPPTASGPQVVYSARPASELGFCGPATPTFVNADSSAPNLDPSTRSDQLVEPWMVQGDFATSGRIELADQAFEIVGYADGRLAIPFEPTILAFHEVRDIQAFVADADEVRAGGAIPSALLHPFTLLAEQIAWRGVEYSSLDQGRFRVDAAGVLSIGSAGPSIGRLDDDWATVAKSARGAAHKAARDRGCATCPIADQCSRSLALRTLIQDEIYCSIRRERPWMPAYLDVVNAMRRVETQPANGVRTALGFGRRLTDHAENGWTWPDRPPAVFLVDDTGVIGVPLDGHTPFELTMHSAQIVEVALGSADLDAAVAGVADLFALERATAADAVAATVDALSVRGVPMTWGSRS